MNSTCYDQHCLMIYWAPDIFQFTSDSLFNFPLLELSTVDFRNNVVKNVGIHGLMVGGG